MKAKKRNILITALAVMLAAAAVFGSGTYAYLEGMSDEVVNDFHTNEVDVELSESGDGQYEIIPGTGQKKDPKVTVNNTVDAYVFVTVKDESDGLVTYQIADGWTELEGYDNVYYREVAADAAQKEFNVLEYNWVSYDEKLVNEDMLDEAGNLKEELKITFQAYAIQKTPFDDPVKAYEKTPRLIMNETELVEAIQNKTSIRIGQDFTVSENNLATIIPDTDLVDIDLNGYTLTFTEAFYAGATFSDGTKAEQHVKISNGGINVKTGKNVTFCSIGESSSMTLDNVVVNSESCYNFYPAGEGAVLNINNCNIKETAGGFIVSTNASNPYSCTVNITDSILESGYTDGWTGIAVMMNVPGTLNITNSTIIGERNAVALRCGTANITDSTLSRPYALTQSIEDGYLNGQWGQGNAMPLATLLVGNRSGVNVYQNPATVTLDGVTLNAYQADGVQGKTVYMYGNTADRIATLNYKESNCKVGTIVQGNENTVVNKQ